MKQSGLFMSLVLIMSATPAQAITYYKTIHMADSWRQLGPTACGQYTAPGVVVFHSYSKLFGKNVYHPAAFICESTSSTACKSYVEAAKPQTIANAKNSCQKAHWLLAPGVCSLRTQWYIYSTRTAP